MKSLDYIVTARHYSKAEGADGTVRGRILKMREMLKVKRGITLQIENIDRPKGEPAVARIWQGQWIADCPSCNGAQFVDPGEPIYFCFVCGNRENGYSVRPVAFPPDDERIEIERLLLERPVNDVAGLTDLERAGLARPILLVADEAGGMVGLSRNWNPKESIDDLARQNEPVRLWKRTASEDGE